MTPDTLTVAQEAHAFDLILVGVCVLALVSAAAVLVAAMLGWSELPNETDNPKTDSEKEL